MSCNAKEALAAGDPKQALSLLQAEIRQQPANVKLRIFLFQLLCVLGQWPRASAQLEVCGEMDAGTLAMVNTYREALKCESVREAVFAGTTTPSVLGQPQEWVTWLIEALQADARGDTAVAARLRAQAFAMAPANSGALNTESFAWIADADSRLGPVLEAIMNGRYYWVPFIRLIKIAIDPPEDLRDIVWMSARLQFENGDESVALIPTRYHGSETSEEGLILLARKTAWEQIGPDAYRGFGQRVFTTDVGESPLMEVRSIELNGASPADDGGDART